MTAKKYNREHLEETIDFYMGMLQDCKDTPVYRSYMHKLRQAENFYYKAFGHHYALIGKHGLEKRMTQRRIRQGNDWGVI